MNALFESPEILKTDSNYDLNLFQSQLKANHSPQCSTWSSRKRVEKSGKYVEDITAIYWKEW